MLKGLFDTLGKKKQNMVTSLLFTRVGTESDDHKDCLAYWLFYSYKSDTELGQKVLSSVSTNRYLFLYFFIQNELLHFGLSPKEAGETLIRKSNKAILVRLSWTRPGMISITFVSNYYTRNTGDAPNILHDRFDIQGVSIKMANDSFYTLEDFLRETHKKIYGKDSTNVIEKYIKVR